MIKNKCGLWGPTPVNEPGYEDEKFEYTRVDEYYPACISENIERWKHLLIPDAAFSVTDLYKEDPGK
jgi:hypothetical protein